MSVHLVISSPLCKICLVSGSSKSEEILASFLSEVDRIAPWFLPTGSLTLGSWDKWGRDLEREAEKGSVKNKKKKKKPTGVKPLWRMVHACLEDKRCVEAVKAGQKILMEQERMSEEEKERMSNRKKKGKKEKGKETGGKIKGISDKEKEIVKTS